MISVAENSSNSAFRASERDCIGTAFVSGWATAHQAGLECSQPEEALNVILAVSRK
jgi:hypothetical protein